MKWLISTEKFTWREATPAISAGTGSNALQIAGPAGPPLMGFGGCFNELGARELFRLGEDGRREILNALFGEEGCAFNFCRLPIGASDYALDWYSHAETPDDYAMAHFSIERDRRHLLPYIRAAQGIRPALRLFASPWSPPVWMKERARYNGSRLCSEPRVHAAYADYLLKFVRAYRDEGVEIEQLHVQNEPNSDQKFPSCLWTGASMRDFIRDHLGPRFEAARERCEIWAGTIERGMLLGWQPESLEGDSYHNWIHTLLSDSEVRRLVKGVGYQWNGKGALAQTRANWPDLPIIQTENECGDGRNTWSYAFYVFDLMWHYFNQGCRAYVYWNMVLPPGGESTWGWKQNTLITVDGASGAITYNPEFYVMKHLAHFVRPGARCVPLRGDQAALSLLFQNADGSRVLVIANPLASPLEADVALEGLMGRLEIAPRSISTVVL
ncbi:MAG: glycosyl hydrolase [Rariglobus sp.]|jgi:glucosylceramidase|nr:glycosyl hydrolase [Rariglobus sp.]